MPKEISFVVVGATSSKLWVAEGSATSRIYRVGHNAIADTRGKVNPISGSAGRALHYGGNLLQHTTQKD